MSQLKTIQVVRAGVNDVPRLKSFLTDAWKAAGPGALGWTGANAQVITELASEQHLSKLLSKPDLEIFLCQEGERVLGFAVNRKLSSNDVELAGVIVLEGATGRGLGTKLVEKAKEAARKQGATRMTVETEIFNQRAITFYEKEGFVKTGTKIEDAKGTQVEMEILELTLN